MSTDRDGLYLNGIRVSSADEISTTYQGNDLTKPATIQTSYSNSFTIPDTIAVRKLTGNAEQLDSRSRLLYQPIRALVIRDGEIVFEGLAELTDFSAGWEISLYEEKRDLFTRLDRSIKTAQLSAYDHEWTVDSINNLANATERVCYPLVDYGLLQDGVQPLDTVFPAMFVKTLVSQLLYEEGYILVGDILFDELYKRLLLPFTESDPTNYDDQWQASRKARVTLQMPNDEVDRGTLGRGNWIDRIQPYSVDNLDTFGQGDLHPYSTTSYTYVCPDAMNLKVTAFQQFKALCVTGAVEVILSVVKNGQDIEHVRFEAGTGYNILFLRTDKLNLNTTIKCKAGDRIQIRLQARRQTQIGAFHILIYNDPDNSFVGFEPQLTTALGDTWKIARNLPEITAKGLLVGIAYALCGTWQVDVKRKQVSFAYFDGVVENIENAVDWSNRIDTSSDIKWRSRIDPYGQTNNLKWKETDESKAAASLVNARLLNYGDGIITIDDAPVLDTDVDLFEMPFGASTDSTQSLPGYGNPVLIKTRTVTGRGDNLSINNQDTIPRLLLASLDDPFLVNSSRIKDDGVTVEPIVLKLKPCWFGKRPDVVSGPLTNYTLSFGPLSLSSEVDLIVRYFEGVQRMLRRMRLVTVTMHFKPKDIAQIDFAKPIRLQRMAVGNSIILSDNYFYLNKIADYQADNLCDVTLIAF